MTIVFTTTTNRAQRRITTRQDKGQTRSTHHRRPWEIAMETVAALLADPASKPTLQEIDALRQQILLIEGSVAPSNILSTIPDTWKALLVFQETHGRGSDLLQARRGLVVVLAEMLCSPVQMPPSHRQRYWNVLQHHFQILNRASDCVRALEHIDRRFSTWMSSLNAVVRYGQVKPVTFPSRLLSHNQRRSAEEELDYNRRPHTYCTTISSNEAQYFGNSLDHWRRHTSHQ